MSDEIEFLTLRGLRCHVPLATYPDTMPLINAAPDGFPARVLLRPKSFASFMAALFWIDAIGERHDHAPHLILPFVPGARQDRLNDSGDYLFTAKSVAKEINARGFPSVTVLDPHSEVTPALIDRCKVVHAADCINPPAGKYAAVISPDAGAEKRAGTVARKLGVPLIHAWKTRDVATGTIAGFGYDRSTLADPLLDGPARMLVVDDICDGGGTFTGLAAEIAKSGFEELDLHLWTTHGIYSKGVAALAEHFSHIYCTDSVAGDRAGVIEVPVCQKLLEGTL
jgi:ribose-phosphate pyrophosphokinase